MPQQTGALNGEGAVAGFADTSISDPFPNPCFWDCLVVHTFRSDRSGVLKDLGALPGGGSSAPNWISPNGLIAGLSENGETDPLYPNLPQVRAVLWKDGNIMDLKTLPEGGYQSEANAVNSSGQVVGAALNTIPDANSMQPDTFWLWGGISPPYAYQTRAFFWDQESGMIDLGTLPGGTDAQALLINEKGQVIGHSYIGSMSSPACLYPLATDSFIWEKETGLVDLGSFGGTCTIATDLNQQGQVVGSSNLKGDKSQEAFLWERGQLHHLGGSLGGSFTGAFAINEQREAAGFGYLTGNSTFHATLWKNLKSITDLGVVGADSCSYAAAINARGQVVGGSSPVCDFDDARAFLWEDGSIFDLNSLIPPASTLYLQLTYAINDRGEIAGTGVDASGNEHAFLLAPCDENHPGVDQCDYSLVDAAAATRVTPVPSIQRLQSANQSKSVRQLLRRGLGPLSHIPNPGTDVVGSPTTPISQNSDWHLKDRIAIDDGAELATGSNLRPVSNAAQNSCPAVHCSSDHTKGRVCGFAICHLPGFIRPIFSGYDLTYKRACVYGC